MGQWEVAARMGGAEFDRLMAGVSEDLGDGRCWTPVLLHGLKVKSLKTN